MAARTPGLVLLAFFLASIAFARGPAWVDDEDDDEPPPPAARRLPPPPRRSLPAPQFLPGHAPLLAPLKADPEEFRPHLTVVGTDKRGAVQLVAAIAFRLPVYEFSITPEIRSQFVCSGLNLTRFDLTNEVELNSEDYRYAISLFYAYRNWTASTELAHHSAHFGDEFIARTRARHYEYVMDELGSTVSYDYDARLRLYGALYLAYTSNDDVPFRTRLGFEYYFEDRYFPGGLGPYVALDLLSRFEDDFKPTSSFVLGYALPGHGEGRTLDLQFTAVTGPSVPRTFFPQEETYFGVGIAGDL